MDSGNSGSLQSSSSGDEEYGSRAESFSAFLDPTGHVGPMSNPPPPPHHHHHHISTTPSMFDPLSNYFYPMSRAQLPSQPPFSNPNSLLNLDMVWPKTTRSLPSCTEINPVVASSSPVQPFFGQTHSRAPFTSSSPALSFPPVTENATSSATSDQTHVVRNPKKRSRASRRAPTTVLTTDTTNFRAMVQEFTGIPSPPFTSSPFPRSRLDLFGTPSAMRSRPLPTSHPHYLLRPFAQKLHQPPPFVSSSSSSLSLSSSLLPSSMGDGGASTATTNNNVTTASAAMASHPSTSLNCPLPSDDQLGLLKHPQNLLNVQDPVLTFQSLLQSPAKYPLPNSAILGSKTHASLELPLNDSHLKMGVFDDFGLSHGPVNTQITALPNLVCPDGTGTASRNDENPVSWGGGDQGPLRSVTGNYNYSRNVSNGKLNFSASSSNFHGEKGSENLPIRGEGTVESWICSSD